MGELFLYVGRKILILFILFRKGKRCERVLLDDPTHIPDTVPMPPEMPENVFLISSLYDANLCLRKLMHMISEAS